MGIATLKRKIDGNLYCSKCMMGQAHIRNTCFYCGAMFSNYEDMVVEIAREISEEEILSESYSSRDED